jgi:uncharacterized protein
MVVHVAELLRRPGSRRAVPIDEPVDGLATTAATAEQVRGVVELESMNDSLVATGTLELRWRGECRRCLDEVVGTTEIELREIFERQPTEGETYPLADEQVDLGPMIDDAMLLALPLAALCREDCPGPAPDLYPTGPGAEEQAPVDPRWAALDQLRSVGEGS